MFVGLTMIRGSPLKNEELWLGRLIGMREASDRYEGVFVDLSLTMIRGRPEIDVR